MTPPPAANAPPLDVDTVIKGAVDVATLPAFEVTLSESNGNYPDLTLKVFSDGAGRFRAEQGEQVLGTTYESTIVTLGGLNRSFGSQIEVDGSTTWHQLGDRVVGVAGYRLALPPTSPPGLDHLVNRVARRPPALRGRGHRPGLSSS